MSDKLHKQVTVEREQLNRLLETHRPLITKCKTTSPNDIELSALAAMLHSFYSGIENIFKRVALEIDQAPPTGDAWHRQLLESMSSSNSRRSSLISQALRDTLKKYLDFRHFFRNAYAFELRWKKMSSLILECEATLKELEQALSSFFNRK